MNNERFMFRAWDKQPRVMSSADSRYFINPNGKLFDYSPLPLWGGYRVSGGLEKFVEIMQCTGLRDNYCNLIWENDILKITEKAYKKIFYRSIQWVNGLAKFDLNHPITDNEHLLDEVLYTGWYEYEIVGNTFENPEWEQKLIC